MSPTTAQPRLRADSLACGAALLIAGLVFAPASVSALDDLTETVAFGFTGSAEQWVVPAGVTVTVGGAGQLVTGGFNSGGDGAGGTGTKHPVGRGLGLTASLAGSGGGGSCMGQTGATFATGVNVGDGAAELS